MAASAAPASTRQRALVAVVSNNPYVLGTSLEVSQRRWLDTGQLGVFAVTARTGAQGAEVVTLALAGQSARSGHAYQFTTPELEVRSRSGTAYAGIDGEALELPTPLRFRAIRGGSTSGCRRATWRRRHGVEPARSTCVTWWPSRGRQAS